MSNSATNARGGYTIVELMLALTVLAIGVTGIMAMQTATAASNRHARGLSTATHIGQSWLNMLAAEAAQWNTQGDYIADTVWLSAANGQQNLATDPEWFKPDYDANLNFGPAFDALGNPVSDLDQDDKAEYCAHLQYAWVFNEDDGSGVLRTAVRVFWFRDGMDDRLLSEGLITVADNICDIRVADVTANPQRFHFVYLTGAVRQTKVIR